MRRECQIHRSHTTGGMTRHEVFVCGNTPIFSGVPGWPQACPSVGRPRPADPMILSRRPLPLLTALLTACIAGLAVPAQAFAYSEFTHEELIDLAWNPSIRPLLLQRYPHTTPAELWRAHGFAYGGCLIQDLGYYPFGKKLFSDLTHYVRSGDFVLALLRSARNVDELAFAIGALSHYIGDSVGHAEAVNPSTAITFPTLERRYGLLVTFEDAPINHIRTEFGFDAAELAEWRYPPRAYRERIGIHVPRRLLEQAFQETYGVSMRRILGPARSAVDTYDLAVRRLIPLFADAAVVDVRNRLPPDPSPPDPALQHLLAGISRTDYARSWSGAHRPPTRRARVLAVLLRLVPKIGALRVLSVRPPSAATEDLFVKSLDAAVSRFEGELGVLAKRPRTEWRLANLDLDTGARVRPGGYRLTDKTYEALLRQLTRRPGLEIPPGLRQDIQAYYADPKAPIWTKHSHKAWMRVQSELRALGFAAAATTAGGD